MRWFWIDCFTEFVSRTRATAIKNVTLSEPHVVDYVPSFSQLSQSLVVEGIAQTGGLLVGQAKNFEARVVLAKLAKARFLRPALPGDTLTYNVAIQSLQPDGAIVSGTSHIGDELQAEIDIMFACLDDRFQGVELFEPAAFLRLLRSMKIFEVGVNEDGSKIEVPPHLLEAEQQSFPSTPVSS